MTYMTVMGELVPLENRLQRKLPRFPVKHQEQWSEIEQVMYYSTLTVCGMEKVKEVLELLCKRILIAQIAISMRLWCSAVTMKPGPLARESSGCLITPPK